MKKSIYDEYCRVIRAFQQSISDVNASQDILFDESVLQENSVKCSEVIVSLKDYKRPSGFSYRITNFQDDIF